MTASYPTTIKLLPTMSATSNTTTPVPTPSMAKTYIELSDTDIEYNNYTSKRIKRSNITSNTDNTENMDLKLQSNDTISYHSLPPPKPIYSLALRANINDTLEVYDMIEFWHNQIMIALQNNLEQTFDNQI